MIPASSRSLGLVAAFSILASGLTAESASAAIKGKYDCDVTNIVLRFFDGGGGPDPDEPKGVLRIPNGKGGLRGHIKPGWQAVGTPIIGRVNSVQVRQGGKKYILGGNWIFKFVKNGASGNAKGKFKRMRIRKMPGGKYDIQVRADVTFNGDPDPGENYRFKARFNGEK